MTKTVRVPGKIRADGQVSGLAGEFFVAAELLKRGVQVAITFGNAKSIDLFAHNPISGRSFIVQVKALRAPNYFPISHSRVKVDCIYVFVVLNKVDMPPDYFIVPGKVLQKTPDQFGKYFLAYEKFPGIHSKELAKFKDNWKVFLK